MNVRLLSITTALLATCQAAISQNTLSTNDYDYDYDAYPDSLYEFVTDSDRVMLNHQGLTFDAGLEVALNSDMHGFGVSLQTSWRFFPQFALGIGIMPGIFADDTEKDSAHSVAADGEVIAVQHTDVEDNYFAMPFYSFCSYELMLRHVSPLFQLRGGAMLSTPDDTELDYYFHAHLGCRVALLSVNVTPFIGYTIIDTDNDEGGMLAFGLTITF